MFHIATEARVSLARTVQTQVDVINKCLSRAVVAQLVQRLLPIPKVRSLNPVIGKNLY